MEPNRTAPAEAAGSRAAAAGLDGSASRPRGARGRRGRSAPSFLRCLALSGALHALLVLLLGLVPLTVRRQGAPRRQVTSIVVARVEPLEEAYEEPEPEPPAEVAPEPPAEQVELVEQELVEPREELPPPRQPPAEPRAIPPIDPFESLPLAPLTPRAEPVEEPPEVEPAAVPPAPPPPPPTPPSGGEEEPLILEMPQPPYPRLAVRAGMEGTVHLSIRVDADGRVVGVSVLESSGHELLDRAAVETVKERWRFRARRPGEPDVRVYPKPIVFRIVER